MTTKPPVDEKALEAAFAATGIELNDIDKRDIRSVIEAYEQARAQSREVDDGDMIGLIYDAMNNARKGSVATSVYNAIRPYLRQSFQARAQSREVDDGESIDPGKE